MRNLFIIIAIAKQSKRVDHVVRHDRTLSHYNMPVATSSRRILTSRRQDSFDIENTRSNQVNGDEDDVSEDDGSRHKIPVKLEKKTNGKAKGKQKADPDDEDGDVGSDYGAADDDDEDRIVVDNFPDHPLQHSDLLKLKGISKDWESMQRQTWDKWDSIKDVAAAIAEARDGDPNQEVAFTLTRFLLISLGSRKFFRA